VRKFVCILTAVLAPVAVLCAQSQVATVTSTASFELRGAKVGTNEGVPSWPVTSGDELKAGAAPIVISFAGGSNITLAPGSSAKITMDGQTPHFVLECGTASYTLSAPSAVKLNSPTSAQTTGSYTKSGCDDQPAGWWTAGRTLLVLGGAAAAAGLALGITYGVNGGHPVSPR
jgi:hypothetical protein